MVLIALGFRDVLSRFQESYRIVVAVYMEESIALNTELLMLEADELTTHLAASVDLELIGQDVWL